MKRMLDSQMLVCVSVGCRLFSVSTIDRMEWWSCQQENLTKTNDKYEKRLATTTPTATPITYVTPLQTSHSSAMLLLLLLREPIYSSIHAIRMKWNRFVHIIYQQILGTSIAYTGTRIFQQQRQQKCVYCIHNSQVGLICYLFITRTIVVYTAHECHSSECEWIYWIWNTVCAIDFPGHVCVLVWSGHGFSAVFSFSIAR